MPLPKAPPPTSDAGWRAREVLSAELTCEESTPENVLARDAVKMLVAAQETPQVPRLQEGENGEQVIVLCSPACSAQMVA